MIEAPSPEFVAQRKARLGAAIRIPRFIQPRNDNLECTDKFVVKKDLIGFFSQGQVVRGCDFQVGTDLDRLCLAGEIRPAMDHELNDEFVDIHDTLKPGASLTQSLNEAEDRNVKLHAEVELLKTKFNELLALKAPNYDPKNDPQVQREERYNRLAEATKALDQSNKEKDLVIASLNAKLQKQGATEKQ